MIRSNGSIEASSRRPTARVTSRISKKTNVVRRTRSIASGCSRPLGQDGQGAVDAGDLDAAVVELDAVGAAPDVGGVDLEGEEDPQEVARRELVVAEHDAAGAARLAPRRRLDRVDLHALQPA